MKKKILISLLTLVIACNKQAPKNIKLLPLKRSCIQDFFKTLKTDLKIPALPIKEEAIKIAFDNYKEKRDDPYQSIEYIPLEETNQSLIKTITKIYFDKNIFIIFDKRNNKVLTFSKEGKFKNQIGEKGTRTKEYQQIKDISIDILKKEICLLDGYQQALLFFDYNGNFLRRELTYYKTTGIECYKNKLIFNIDNKTNKQAPHLDFHRLIIARKDQTPEFLAFKISSKLQKPNSLLNTSKLKRSGNRIFYHSTFSDTIWRITNQDCQAKFIITKSKDKSSFKQKERENINKDYYQIKLLKKRYFSDDYAITKEFLYFTTKTPHSSEQFLYNRKKKELMKLDINLYSSKDKLRALFRTLSIGEIYGSFDDTTFYTYENTAEFIRRLKSYERFGFYKQLTKKEQLFIESIKEHHNPIIMLIKFKQ